MLTYLYSKPPGGGPAPLIKNPIKGWVYVLLGVHVVLFFLSTASFVFSSMWDVSCTALRAGTSYTAVCGVVALGMTFYFSLVSCERWGTERDWSITTVVTMSMAVADVCVAAWGVYCLVIASQYLFGGSEQVERGCQEVKAVFSYCAMVIVICVHGIVALCCAAAAVVLTQRVGSQLQNIRRMV